MSAITTHVLDTVSGRPALGVPVGLDVRDGDGWRSIGRGITDGNGRLRTLVPASTVLDAGAYRLVFDTARYFAGLGLPAFFPRVTVEFEVAAHDAHHHVPLLLSPFGYTTYRGT